MQLEELLADISSAINRNSRENESNTPDFILGEFVMDVLVAFEKAVNRREEWHGLGHEEVRGGDNANPS